MYKAILSTTVLPQDGNYSVYTLTDAQIEKLNLTDIPHFVGHPATKEILDGLRAVYTPGLFTGLEPGEIMLAVSIKQGLTSRGEVGHTVHQNVTKNMLSFRVVQRAAVCGFCNKPTYLGWACGNCGAT